MNQIMAEETFQFSSNLRPCRIGENKKILRHTVMRGDILILWSVESIEFNKDFSFRKLGIHSSEFRITEEDYK